MDGVTATVNYATEKAKVSYPAGIRVADLIATVVKTGYTAAEPAPPEPAPQAAPEEPELPEDPEPVGLPPAPLPAPRRRPRGTVVRPSWSGGTERHAVSSPSRTR
ncbi:heavy metal-associated domain-containing protein [Streptomyces sp. DT2A-34]|nr:heavy metal-associated domain-containing protein [Streptomyces sp. DT2A-34]MDO0914812.1 heavy metal-associated domain-containing protein [Streptomyces sp. DT2A-34]